MPLDQMTFPNFPAQRGRINTHLRRSIVGVILFYLVPVAALLALDLAGRWLWLRTILALTPLLSLNHQVRCWFCYIRRFGFPPVRHLVRMVKLDDLRGYESLSNSIRSDTPNSFAATLMGSSAIILLGWLWWSATAWSLALYFSSFGLMIAIKASIRRSRPPAVLLLGASGSDITSLQLRIMTVAHPLLTVSCLRHSSMDPILNRVVHFFSSYRSGDETTWRIMVRGLIEMSQVVVFDLRQWTEPVGFEVDCVKALVPSDRLFVLEGAIEHGLSDDRCFSEDGLIEKLDELLWGSTTPSRERSKRDRRWIDKRNQYFTVIAPPGWKSLEYDDPRSKVTFVHPRSRVSMTFIVRESTGEGHQPPAETLRRVQEKGWSCSVGENEILGVPCSEVLIQAGGANYTNSWVFVINGLHFAITFSAPTGSMFDLHYSKARQAIETIEISKPIRHGFSPHSE